MKIIYHYLEIIDSTNNWSKKNLNSFERNALTVVAAAEQTRGRGQYSRRWVSPKGVNLYASFCFFVPKDDETIKWVRLFAELMQHALHEKGLTAAIKLPNDLFVAGKKIAGILCETIPCNSLTGIILGIGLNINMTKDQLDQIEQPATSILNETGKKTDIIDFLKTFSIRVADQLIVDSN